MHSRQMQPGGVSLSRHNTPVAMLLLRIHYLPAFHNFDWSLNAGHRPHEQSRLRQTTEPFWTDHGLRLGAANFSASCFTFDSGNCCTDNVVPVLDFGQK